MEIAYELTQTDFVEAFATHRKRNSTGKMFLLVLYWIGVAFACYLVWGVVRAHDTTKLFLLLFLVTFWIVVVEIYPRWNVRRQFVKQPGAHGPRKLILDASGVHWRWNSGSADVEWRNYTGLIEGPTQILFYGSPSGFNILPKRVLSPDQLSELRILLAENIRTPE
jgi:hypothetical protein